MSKPDVSWKLEELPVSDVRKRVGLQVGVAGLSMPYVRELAREIEAGANVEAISVAKIGTALYVVDGFHRLQAAKLAGKERLLAKVAKMSVEEARQYAIRANSKKRMQPRQKDRIFSEFIAQGKHLGSDGRAKPSLVIGRELGNIYCRETIRRKLRAVGVVPEEGVEFSGQHRSRMTAEEVARDRLVKARRALDSFAETFTIISDANRQALLQTAREFLGKLERGEQPERLTGGLLGPG